MPENQMVDGVSGRMTAKQAACLLVPARNRRTVQLLRLSRLKAGHTPDWLQRDAAKRRQTTMNYLPNSRGFGPEQRKESKKKDPPKRSLMGIEPKLI